MSHTEAGKDTDRTENRIIKGTLLTIGLVVAGPNVPGAVDAIFSPPGEAEAEQVQSLAPGDEVEILNGTFRINGVNIRTTPGIDSGEDSVSNIRVEAGRANSITVNNPLDLNVDGNRWLAFKFVDGEWVFVANNAETKSQIAEVQGETVTPLDQLPVIPTAKVELTKVENPASSQASLYFQDSQNNEQVIGEPLETDIG